MEIDTTLANKHERVAKKESEGAWIIHHGKKLAMDSDGPSEFPAIDQAAKATSFIVALAATNDEFLPIEKVRKIGQASKLNPKRETDTFLDLLEEKRLIERRDNGVNVLGLTNRAALQHAADLFHTESPEPTELAALELAEITSTSPVQLKDISEYIGDTYKFTKEHSKDFIRRSEEIGFIDAEGEPDNRLIFNGNLFRKDGVAKAKKVLDSLSSSDQMKMVEMDGLLKQSGCVKASRAQQILGAELLNKLKAASVYEIHTVQNGSGLHNFITSPSAFHKFVSPMIDDAFDLAKALVAALTYGMTERSSSSGRIQSIDLLLGKLIAGRSVGPATAIGQDYRVLEEKRVVEIIPEGYGYRMRLLKREVGEIALQVLQRGDAAATIIDTPPAAAMSGYLGPEETRWTYRKQQGTPSKKATFSIIDALRSNRKF